MGEIGKIVPPGKLIFGILVTSESVRSQCLDRLTAAFGPLDHQSHVELFTFTDYYCDEMGQTIYRQYLSAQRLVNLDDLPALKHRTNEIELDLARMDEQGRRCRQANVDPGYLTQSKVVLASTKDYGHRIYIAEGIFAEVTLYYRRPNGFQPYPWTYPDYARPEVCEFFNKVRETYRRQSQGLDLPKGPKPHSDTEPDAET